MKVLIALCALVAVASAGHLAAVPAVHYAAPAVHYAASPYHFAGSTQHRAQDTLGQYNYGFASTDGTHKSEARAIDGSVAGSYGYTAPDGQRIETAYTAGAGGFRAVGNAIPVPVGPTPAVAAATAEHYAAHANAAYAAAAPVAYAAPAVAYAAPAAVHYAAAPAVHYAAAAPAIAYGHRYAYGGLGQVGHFGYKFHA